MFLRGTAKFSKLTNLDVWGKWSCTIYPDQESMVKVHKLIADGIKNKIRKDDDGYCITFSRAAKINTKSKGEVDMSPVEVTDENDMIIKDKFVQDGSDITMKLDTYGGPSASGFGLYKAARLSAIKVHGIKATRPILS